MRRKIMETKLCYALVPSPIGELTLIGDDSGLHGVFFADARAGAVRERCVADSRPLRAAIRQMEQYFAGRRTSFELSLTPRGTAFQRRVWTALSEIPFGRTSSYVDVARRIGEPSAARAVGAANGKNPLPVIVPCHRVIGADGSLTGFGGGIDRKRWLLDFEASGAVNAGARPLRLASLSP
jgi:methylated-DNA-[protein]-cysteine S-methyltransferase